MAKDQSFQILLDAENKAEDLIDQARKAHDRLLDDTLEEVHQQEHLFSSRIPEIHESSLDRALQQAEQVITTYQQHYDERANQLRELAEQREDEALDVAFKLFMNSRD